MILFLRRKSFKMTADLRQHYPFKKKKQCSNLVHNVFLLVTACLAALCAHDLWKINAAHQYTIMMKGMFWQIAYYTSIFSLWMSGFDPNQILWIKLKIHLSWSIPGHFILFQSKDVAMCSLHYCYASNFMQMTVNMWDWAVCRHHHQVH